MTSASLACLRPVTESWLRVARNVPCLAATISSMKEIRPGLCTELRPAESAPEAFGGAAQTRKTISTLTGASALGIVAGLSVGNPGAALDCGVSMSVCRRPRGTKTYCAPCVEIDTVERIKQ